MQTAWVITSHHLSVFRTLTVADRHQFRTKDEGPGSLNETEHEGLLGYGV